MSTKIRKRCSWCDSYESLDIVICSDCGLCEDCCNSVDGSETSTKIIERQSQQKGV